jgi:hypothetical protein
MAAGFPAKTSFTDGSVLPASDLNDLGGTINKIYNATFYPYQLSLTSTADSVLRPLPFATSTDKITYATNIAVNAGASVTVTFSRSTRFTQNPIITTSAEVTASSGTPFASTSIGGTSTTSGFTFRVFNVGTVTITNTYLHYHAIQMTSAASDNN